MSCPVIQAAHPKLGTLWAAIDPSVRFIEGGVRDSRFAARLAPFHSQAEAVAALKAAGGTLQAKPKGRKAKVAA